MDSDKPDKNRIEGLPPEDWNYFEKDWHDILKNVDQYLSYSLKNQLHLEEIPLLASPENKNVVDLMYSVISLVSRTSAEVLNIGTGGLYQIRLMPVELASSNQRTIAGISQNEQGIFSRILLNPHWIERAAEQYKKGDLDGMVTIARAIAHELSHMREVTYAPDVFRETMTANDTVSMDESFRVLYIVSEGEALARGYPDELFFRMLKSLQKQGAWDEIQDKDIANTIILAVDKAKFESSEQEQWEATTTLSQREQAKQFLTYLTTHTFGNRDQPVDLDNPSRE